MTSCQYYQTHKNSFLVVNTDLAAVCDTFPLRSASSCIQPFSRASNKFFCAILASNKSMKCSYDGQTRQLPGLRFAFNKEFLLRINQPFGGGLINTNCKPLHLLGKYGDAYHIMEKKLRRK